MTYSRLGIILLLLLALWGADSYLRVGSRQDLLWLHRTNTPAKLTANAETYGNYELDVIIRPDTCGAPQAVRLDISHEEDTTAGISLADIAAALPAPTANTHLWLDTKNLTTANATAYADALDALRESHILPPPIRIIVESHDAAALRLLHTRGYATSLYLANRAPRRHTPQQRDSLIAAATQAWQEGSITYVSAHVSWRATLEERLPESIPLLLWDHRTTQWEFFLTPWKRLWLTDARIKAILLKGK